MDAIEKQEADLKKKLENVDTLDERREIRRKLRELRKQAEQLEGKGDIKAKIIPTTSASTSTKDYDDSNNKKEQPDANENSSLRITSAEERRSRREARLNAKNKEEESDTLKTQKESKPEPNANDEAVNKEKSRNSIQKTEEIENRYKEGREESTETDNINSNTEICRNKEGEITTEKIGQSEQNLTREKLESTNKETVPQDKKTDVQTSALDTKKISNVEKQEQKSLETMNGSMQSLSLRNKDTTDRRDGGRFDRNKGTSPFGDKVKARGTIGKALSVSQMKDRFGQGGPSRTVEFGSSFGKKSDKEQATDSKSSVKSNLRETNTSESYRREVPKPKHHHLTAPAGIMPPPPKEEEKPCFTTPGLGGSAADRMAFFRQAAEKEKEKKEKELQRQRLASAPEDLSMGSKDNRTAPCKKKLDGKRPLKRTKSISSIVLDWCKEMVRDYGVELKNFSSSWNNGMAFCALIHHFESDAFDFKELKPENREHNFRLAFETANKRKNIPMLLDVNDMVQMKNPEPRSVQCYIQWIWRIYGPTSGSYNEEEIKAAQIA